MLALHFLLLGCRRGKRIAAKNEATQNFFENMALAAAGHLLYEDLLLFSVECKLRRPDPVQVEESRTWHLFSCL